MPPDSSLCREDSGYARLSRSPYQQAKEVRLREDSQGNIEGVEYLAGLSGYAMEDDYERAPCKPASVGSSTSRSLKNRYSNSGSRRSSLASDRRSSVDRKWPYPSRKKDVSGNTRLCPSPGKRPSAQFTLSSPEMSCKEESTDDDIPKFSLAEGYIPQPRSPISKSPLLNRDILRFINDAAAGDALELDPMIFASSLSEGDSNLGSRRNEAVEVEVPEILRSELFKDKIEGVEEERSTMGEGAVGEHFQDEPGCEESYHQGREDAKQDGSQLHVEADSCDTMEVWNE